MPITQGILSSMNFDVDTALFSAEFTYSTEAKGVSTAYLNQEYWYTGGGGPGIDISVNDVIVEPATVEVATSEGANYYSFDMARHAGIQDGDKVKFNAARYPN